MNAHDLADWIDQNYPRLSPYIITKLDNLKISLIENNANSSLCLLYLEHYKDDSWASSGVRDIEPGKYPKERDAPAYFGQVLKSKKETDEDFLERMKPICEGCVEIIDWYESLPYEENRATLVRELGFKPRTLSHPTVFMANDFAADIIIDFPCMQHLCFKAKIGKWDSDKADFPICLYALTLDELLQKIVKGEIE